MPDGNFGRDALVDLALRKLAGGQNLRARRGLQLVGRLTDCDTEKLAAGAIAVWLRWGNTGTGPAYNDGMVTRSEVWASVSGSTAQEDLDDKEDHGGGAEQHQSPLP